MSVRQADIASSYRQIIRMDWEVELSESQNLVMPFSPRKEVV